MGRTAGQLVGFLLVVCASASAGAQTAADQRAPASGERGWHFSGTVGWFSALTGPLSHGPAAELELYPGGALGKFGLGLYYRGDQTLAPGTVLVGFSYEAGASRPRLVISLHGEIGYDRTSDKPVAGAGVRTVLGVSGPLVMCANATSHLFFDGVDTRLGLAATLSLGLAN